MEITHTSTATASQQHTRPPVVVVLGHVDHGKSKILEAIRKTSMLAKESGGITQHIGAYEVEYAPTDAKHPKNITFIDTPGHEAFSKMRSRGAAVADIAILVVAADEGVKTQTKEAISVILEQKLPFVVAINKIDRPEANPERVKAELAEANVLVESYGGKIPCVELSAQTGEHLTDLIDMILLVAEIEHLNTDLSAPAQGVVIESHHDSRRGNTVTLLIREGTLNAGDAVLIGRQVETARIFENFRAQPIREAGASQPVRLAGLSGLPLVGEEFRVCSDRSAAEAYLQSLPTEIREPQTPRHSSNAAQTRINIILKADTAGSLEALEELVRRLPAERVSLNILKSGVGDISESDVKFAQATGEVTVVAFRVGALPSVRELAKHATIKIISGEIIYEIVDTLKAHIAGLLPAEVKRTPVGRAKLLKVFSGGDQKQQIVGGRVEEGSIRNNVRVDVLREKTPVGAGVIKRLQHGKTAVDSLEKGSEFGITLDADTLAHEGDILEIYTEETIPQTL